MGEKQVTVMILKVDLQCECCSKRVKKVLCKFPEIRDRIFDEKSNTVMIKVFSCDPEKIRYRLCKKGRGSIKSIEIKEPEQPKTVENPKPDPPKPQEATPPPPPVAKPESPKNPPPAKSQPGQNPPDSARKAPQPVHKPSEPAQEQPKTAQKSPESSFEPAAKAPDSAPKPFNSEPRPLEPVPSFSSEPLPTCCEQCYGGRAGGPCSYGYGPPPPGYCDGYYYGRMGYNGYGPNRVCHPGRCAEYFSEENPAGCSVM